VLKLECPYFEGQRDESILTREELFRGRKGGAVARDLINKLELDKVFAAQPLQSRLLD